MNIEKFGPFLQSQRKSKGMTQGDLAEKLHVTDKAVSRWERGVGFPDIKLLEPLAEALEISVAELLRCEIIDPQVPEEPVEVPQEQITVFADEGKRMAQYKQGMAACKVGTVAMLLILGYYAGKIPEPWWLHPMALLLVWLARTLVERLLKRMLRPGSNQKQPLSYHVMFAVYGAGIIMVAFQRTVNHSFNDFAAENWGIMSAVLRLVGLVGMLFTDKLIES